MPKRYALFFCKKDSEKSNTGYLGKYHVLLGQVSRETLQSIISLKNAIVGLTFWVIIGFVAYG